LLTTSLDLQIKIWDVASGSNPRTFTSHKGRITDLLMIERGRNFISSSLDGSVKLWDCGSGTNFSTFSRKESFKDGITTLYLASNDGHFGNDQHEKKEPNPNEFGTEGKLLLAGHESGVVSGYDLYTRNQVLTLSSLGAETISLWKHHNTVISGYKNGVVAKWDIRNTSEPSEKLEIAGTLKNMVSDGNRVLLSYDCDSTIIGFKHQDLTDRRTYFSGVDENITGMSLSDGVLYTGTLSTGDIYEYDVVQ